MHINDFVKLIKNFESEIDCEGIDCYDCPLKEKNCDILTEVQINLECEEVDDFEEDEDDECERWRYSDYENKDISDWDVDDHLAAWYDDRMEK